MLGIGEIVRTSYGTGPYRITDIDGPCQCPEYLRHIDGDETPSEEHYHLECVGADGSRSWLNGYRADGSSVWDDDTLIFDGTERFRTLDLFAVTAPVTQR